MEMDSNRVPWYSSVAPSLLTNRTIRNYLNSYSEHLWPQILKLTLLYGIVGLQQQHPQQQLSVLQLKQIVQKAATALVVQRNVPQLQRQILGLQGDLDKVFDRLTLELPLGPEASAPAAAQQATPGQEASYLQPTNDAEPVQQQRHCDQNQWRTRAVQFAEPASELSPQNTRRLADHCRRHRVHRAVVAPKPSGAWRAGEASGFPSPPRTGASCTRALDNQGATNPIYPEWWLTVAEPAPAAVPVQPRPPPRQQPRLAYSVMKHPQPQLVTSDDLVTPEYLLATSSGLGQHSAALGRQLQERGVVSRHTTTDGIAAAQQQPQCAPQENQAPTCSLGVQRQQAAGRLRRAKKPVESKIKQLITAARQQAAQSAKQRQDMLAFTVSAGCTAEQPTQQAAMTAAEAPCPPASAADQFISNPWTSWFIPDAAAHQAAWTGPAGAAAGRIEVLKDDQQNSDNDGRTSSSSDSVPAACAEIATVPEEVSVGAESPDDLQTPADFGVHVTSSAKEDNMQSHLQQPAASSQQPTVSSEVHKRAWAFDFGHLDVPELDQAAVISRGSTTSQAAVKPRQKWSEKWVGYFGHLEGPRFTSQTAFNHHHSHEQQQHDGQVVIPDADGSDPDSNQGSRSKLLLSAEELQHLLTAAKEFVEGSNSTQGMEWDVSDPWSAQQQQQQEEEEEEEEEEEASTQLDAPAVIVDEKYKAESSTEADEAVHPSCSVADTQDQPGWSAQDRIEQDMSMILRQAIAKYSDVMQIAKDMS